MFRKKIPFGRIIPPFFCKSSESGRFSFIYMMRIGFFGPGELIQNYFQAAQHCMCLKTMMQWSKWSTKEGVLQWDMFPGLTELHLIGCLIELIWTPKIQIKYIETKNQLADNLTKGNFTRDEWNHSLCLFNISHFSSTVCSATMAKRCQQDSGEERVTAKSRPMMNLIARTPSFVSSSTSVSPGKKHYGSQDPWKSVAGEDRSGRPGKETDLFEASDHYYHEQFMESFSSTDYSKLDYNRAWSSQEWKAEATTHDRSGRPDKTSLRMVRKVRPDHEEILLDGTAQSVRYGETLRDRSGRPDNINSQEVANSQNFIMGDDETELELSGESRSFVNRVNDQVRKRQKRISNVTGEGEELSMIWWMFMAVTMESATFMGKNFQDNQNSIVNTAGVTLKQMFDISAKLVAEQDEISNLETIGWEKPFMEIFVINWWWKNHQSSTRESLRLFRFCVVSRKDPSKSRCQRSLEEKDRMDHNFSKLQRLWRNRWRADGIRVKHLPRIRYVAALW